MNIALHPRRFAILGVALALVAVALMPGTWRSALAQTAGPPPPPPATVSVTVIINNTVETIVTTPGGLASLTIPPGSQITSIALDVITSPAATGATADAALSAVIDFIDASGLTGTATGTEVGYLFEIDFNPGQAANFMTSQPMVMNGITFTQLGGTVFQAGSVLPEPGVATLNVLPETLAQVGGDLSRLFVVFVDPVAGVSEEVTMLPSPGAGQLSFEFTKEGSYAVLVRPIAGAPEAPAPAETGMGAAEETGATNPLAIALGAAALLGIAGLGARFAMGRRSV
ncbi:MAG: hypothetical protein AB7F65_08010 [Dehalococcoidia bacterium]